MFHFMVAERASTSEAEAGKIEDLHAATYAAKTQVISHKNASSKKWPKKLKESEEASNTEETSKNV